MVNPHHRADAGLDVLDGHRLTVAVQEQFLLVDPESGENADAARRVLGALPDGVRPPGVTGARGSVIRLTTPVCADLVRLGAHLARQRRMGSAAAVTAGVRLVAAGAAPVGERLRVPGPRRPEEAPAADGTTIPVVCGCRVRVAVPDRLLAAQVCERLRVWLSVLQALTANSPFARGADTGHASWRSVLLQRRTGIGVVPAPPAACGVVTAGLTTRWYARPADPGPAVEVCVGDVCLTAGDSVLIAGLVRALVAGCIADLRAGLPAPRVRPGLLAAAHWRAAHHGLDGTLIDVRLGVTRPAWDLVDELAAWASPGLLAHGDVQVVVGELSRLRHAGTGAARQRAIHRRTGDVPAMLAELAEHTVAG